MSWLEVLAFGLTMVVFLLVVIFDENDNDNWPDDH
jgi:hypothetical protein